MSDLDTIKKALDLFRPIDPAGRSERLIARRRDGAVYIVDEKGSLVAMMPEPVYDSLCTKFQK